MLASGRKADTLAGKGAGGSGAGKRQKKDLASAYALGGEVAVSGEVDVKSAKPILIRVDTKAVPTVAEEPSCATDQKMYPRKKTRECRFPCVSVDMHILDLDTFFESSLVFHLPILVLILQFVRPEPSQECAFV